MEQPTGHETISHSCKTEMFLSLQHLYCFKWTYFDIMLPYSVHLQFLCLSEVHYVETLFMGSESSHAVRSGTDTVEAGGNL